MRRREEKVMIDKKWEGEKRRECNDRQEMRRREEKVMIKKIREGDNRQEMRIREEKVIIDEGKL